mmetsp:Transcript_149414/g.461245  ORF Transcript_149414/g.461245 Transcript_149414/m.461245 type:complete len:343 (-) Transcript_149414:227-1255(-)
MWSTLLFVLPWRAIASGPSCLDADGREVDFWYILCHPQGTQYAYADSRTPTLSSPDGTLDAETSPLSRTLLQAYKKGVGYAMWNDEHPDGTKIKAPMAHAKGVVAFDSEEGFWLTHSLPRFPQKVAKGYKSSWEAAAHDYGQSYLCLSLHTAALSQVGDAMITNRPSIYDFHVPDFADEKVPNFRTWTGGEHADQPTTRSQTVRTRGGTDFLVFSKSAAFGKDLYAEYVAPKLGLNLLTETWQNGGGNLPSACKGEKGAEYSVLNSNAVSIDGAKWSDKSDHSKWAVAERGSVFCVGDINRQSGQFSRGGGTICLRDARLGKQMRSAITSYQECKGTAQVIV